MHILQPGWLGLLWRGACCLTGAGRLRRLVGIPFTSARRREGRQQGVIHTGQWRAIIITSRGTEMQTHQPACNALLVWHPCPLADCFFGHGVFFNQRLRRQQRRMAAMSCPCMVHGQYGRASRVQAGTSLLDLERGGGSGTVTFPSAFDMAFILQVIAKVFQSSRVRGLVSPKSVPRPSHGMRILKFAPAAYAI